MTQENLNAKGFIVLETEIKPITYRDYLNEYGQDLTTTPNGVSARIHIREVEVSDCQCQDVNERGYVLHEEDCNGEHIEYQVWSWGVNGNNPRYSGTSFDNEEDADLYCYERAEWYISEKNWDAPNFHASIEYAEDEIIERLSDKYNIDNSVAKHILRKMEIVNDLRQERELKITAENKARKTWLSVEVQKEAASITVDEDFKAAIKWASEATGNEKSNRMASALKGLLARNNKDKIETDFWQVLRILKSQTKIN